MPAQSPDQPEHMTAEDLRQQAEQEGLRAVQTMHDREIIAFGQAMRQHDAQARLVGAKASLLAALALLILVATVSLPVVLWVAL